MARGMKKPMVAITMQGNALDKCLMMEDSPVLLVWENKMSKMRKGYKENATCFVTGARPMTIVLRKRLR
jgi:hypothetical protein